MKIVETSLNLRTERGKRKEDYLISKDIAKKQLYFFKDTDIFANVEFMDCDNAGYLKEFEDLGYNSYISLDPKGRGVLCEIKKEYTVHKVGELTEPHMLHLKVEEGKKHIDLIVVRILVAGSNNADFKSRRKQWQNIIDYIDSLPEKSHIILTGDFNHGVISNFGINGYLNSPRKYFNYETILTDLQSRDVFLYPIAGNSYRGYMKIDHIATGAKITVDTAEYKDIFCNTEVIGIPDHSCIVSTIECA